MFGRTYRKLLNMLWHLDQYTPNSSNVIHFQLNIFIGFISDETSIKWQEKNQTKKPENPNKADHRHNNKTKDNKKKPALFIHSSWVCEDIKKAINLLRLEKKSNKEKNRERGREGLLWNGFKNPREARGGRILPWSVEDVGHLRTCKKKKKEGETKQGKP